MYIKWLEDFINNQVKYMTEEQIEHFKKCAIKLNGKDNLIEVFNKYSYNDFIQLDVLNYEEIQILDTITDEIAYMKEDENSETNNISTEYEELKDLLSHSGISLVDYKIHGDIGMSIVALYFDSSVNK